MTTGSTHNRLHPAARASRVGGGRVTVRRGPAHATLRARSRGWRLLVPALAGATLACGARPAADTPPLPTTAPMSDASVAGASPVASSTSAEVTPIYLGRFVFAAPRGATAGLDGAEIDRIEIRAAAWGRDSTASQAWTARVRELESDPVLRPRGVPSTVQIERQVGSHTRLLFSYASSQVPDARVAEALVDRGPASLWLRIPYGKGFEDKVLAGVARFADAYQPEESGPRSEDVPAYHLPRGAVRLPFGFEESLLAYIRGGASGLHDLTVDIDSREDPDWGHGPIAEARAKATSPLIASIGIHMQVVRAGARTVAGLPGEEVITHGVSDGNEPVLAFSWEYRGKSGDPSRPHLAISAEAKERAQVQAMAAWEHLLSETRALKQVRGGTPGEGR